MQIYLPIAEMAVEAESIFLVSAFAGFLSALFGIGGGFLTTPFMIFSGVPPAIAVGTQPCQIAANGTAGMLGYLRKGNIDVKMGSVMLCGGMGGSAVGILIFKLLQYTGQIDFVISVLYVLLLGTIGSLMLYESVRAQFASGQTIRKEFNSYNVPGFMARLPLKMHFPRSKLYISALVPAAVGFVSGILAAILGIGGGFMLVPAMIYIIGMPGLVVAGTSLFQIVLTTAFAAILHATANHTLDILLAVILIFGGVIGAQIGVTLTGVVKGIYARILLASLILFVSLQLAGQMVITPAEFFSTVVR